MGLWVFGESAHVVDSNLGLLAAAMRDGQVEAPLVRDVEARPRT